MTTLKFVSNKEGAHVDIEKDTEVKDMERVHFGHVTYPHLVAMLVASYLLHQYRTAFREGRGPMELVHWYGRTLAGGVQGDPRCRFRRRDLPRRI